MLTTLRFGADEIDVFLLCQAHAQLESDYNVGGWVRERPSNWRRRESTSCQLHRLGFSNPHGWVDIEAEPDADDDEDEDVRYIYVRNVINWKLPMTERLKAVARRLITEEFLQKNAPQVFEPGDYRGPRHVQ